MAVPAESLDPLVRAIMARRILSPGPVVCDRFLFDRSGPGRDGHLNFEKTGLQEALGRAAGTGVGESIGQNAAHLAQCARWAADSILRGLASA